MMMFDSMRTVHTIDSAGCLKDLEPVPVLHGQL